MAERSRQRVILCCLEGRTRDEAAETLGCSVAAVKSRLERGRSLLRRRLERRGIELPAAFLILGLTGGRVRASLWAETIQSALHAPSPAVAALVPAGALSLTGKLTLTACLRPVSSASGRFEPLKPIPRSKPEPGKRAFRLLSLTMLNRSATVSAIRCRAGRFAASVPFASATTGTMTSPSRPTARS
jgi:hypothetical protein